MSKLNFSDVEIEFINYRWKYATENLAEFKKVPQKIFDEYDIYVRHLFKNNKNDYLPVFVLDNIISTYLSNYASSKTIKSLNATIENKEKSNINSTVNKCGDYIVPILIFLFLISSIVANISIYNVNEKLNENTKEKNCNENIIEWKCDEIVRNNGRVWCVRVIRDPAKIPENAEIHDKITVP